MAGVTDTTMPPEGHRKAVEPLTPLPGVLTLRPVRSAASGHNPRSEGVRIHLRNTRQAYLTENVKPVRMVTRNLDKDPGGVP